MRHFRKWIETIIHAFRSRKQTFCHSSMFIDRRQAVDACVISGPRLDFFHYIVFIMYFPAKVSTTATKSEFAVFCYMVT